MKADITPNRALRFIVPAAALAAVALAVFVVFDRMALDQRAAERRALIERAADLTGRSLAPGSPLACLDAGTGEATEAACEAAVFATPQSTAAAVAYIGARLALIADAQGFAAANKSAAPLAGFATARRALELDRYGIAAHVLAVRDGCAPDHCAALALFTDAAALKANMKAQAFDQYISRHATAWNAPVAPASRQVSQGPAAAQTASAAPQAGQPVEGQVAHPLSDKYDFPSAASIPPVSIMNSEPALPKSTAAAQAAEFKSDAKVAAKAGVPGATEAAGVPVPPKRPQVPPSEAAPPAPVR